MNASNLYAAIATFAFAGSAFAAGIPAANATASTAAAAAAQVSVAAKSLTVQANPPSKAGPTRAEVRAEAEEAVRNRRSSEASQFDWITK